MIENIYDINRIILFSIKNLFNNLYRIVKKLIDKHY